MRNSCNLFAGVTEVGQATEGSVWLSIIVPVHNEGEPLAFFFQELTETLSSTTKRNYEIILVDDASTDSALGACPKSERLKILRLDTRGGSGAARKKGIEVSKGEVIAWIDADGTYDPKSLATLLIALINADQVVGVRSIDYGCLKWLRLGAKRASFVIASLLWLRWIPDLNSGLRVFRRSCLLSWLHHLPDGFSCTSTATLAALNYGQKIIFVPIPYRARAIGAKSKFHPVLDTLKMLRTIFRMRFLVNASKHVSAGACV